VDRGCRLVFWTLAVLVTLGACPSWARNQASLTAPEAESTQQVRPVVVASKPFAESFVLAELFAAILEARGIAVERRPGLGATEIAFQALRTGAIDVYPEYTGTGLLALLGETPSGDAGAVFRRVSRAFLDRWGLRWLPSLGFENTYAVAVRRATADSLRLVTLSDLAREGPSLVGGFSPDFLGRDDGLPGLEAAYGLTLADVRPLLQAVKYSALVEGAVDVIDGYSTDGAIARFDLVVLRDDRSFFPPYEAAALIGERLATDHPRAVAVLTELSGRLDEPTMRAANQRVEVDGVAPATVARELLVELGLSDSVRDLDAAESAPDRPAFWPYLWGRRVETARLTVRHLELVGLSLLLALLVAIPLGLLMERLRAGAEGVIRGVGLLQTVPSIALLAFMIPLLGIGFVPAVVALFLYSLFPIVRNTYTGVRDADPVAVAAAVALGMTPRQALLQVRLPLAAPIILAGVRTAAVINVGTATLAAFIGAGGLGDPIVAGLALSDTRLILSGAMPAAVLALLVDGGLELVERRLTPRGLDPS
jgi:osmoprotectant transport system permease protein